MRLFLSLCLILTLAVASDVVILDESNFDTIVNGDKHVLVEFFAPWCGHCKTLAPEYELAATAFKSTSDVVIASVDADKHKTLGGRFDVKGFPTIKFFKKGGKTAEDYSGARTADGIVQYINDKAGARGRIKKAPSHVKVLDKNNFDSVVDGSKNVLVEFYAPWCGHCKTLAPKYEELGKIFSSETDVVIASVDADGADGRPLGEKFEVKGFPTLKFFKKGSTKAEDYTAGREVADFVTFLNANAGTQRLATGGLAPTAGRLASLDAHVKQLVSKAKASVQSDIETASAALTGLEKDAANFYKVVAKNFETQGRDFITKQKERLANLLKSDSVTGAKRDEFQRKTNILTAFEEAQ